MKIFLNILLVLLFVEAWATDQDPDILNYQGSKYYLYTRGTIDSPLESFSQITEELQRINKGWMSSGCWRNYTAEWIIEGGELYLKEVKNCKDGKNINSLVEKAINRKFKDGKIKADWVNGIYWAGNGMRYWNAFENEIKFQFQDGVIISMNQFKSSECNYQDQETLKSFIYSNINWKNLPNKWEQVSIEFETDNEGKIIQTNVINNVDDEFVKEALRVLQMVPCWKIFTHTGEVFGRREIDITFSEANRNKYKQ